VTRHLKRHPPAMFAQRTRKAGDSRPHHVFAYGSLVAAGAVAGTLLGGRRVWGVAMDNRVAVPGYKVYESGDGHRPPVDVAFLDLVPADAGHAVHGALLPVDTVALAGLDRRERQYRRVDVTARMAGHVPGRVWAYLGRPEARHRVQRGHAGHRRVVIQRAYLDCVHAAFAALGRCGLERYRATTEAPPFPVVDLARVDLPG
jgi:gamma-glutamylcyclotransferase (GGCT)/AIG2-like uncharacterized protein YtfP